MTKGEMRCIGTPAHLKYRFGRGYRVELKAPRESAERLAACVQRQRGEGHGREARNADQQPGRERLGA